MLAFGFTGWHFLIIFGFTILPLITAGIGIPVTLVPHYNRIKRGELQQGPTYNVLSIIGFVLAFAFAIVGVILAHVALSQIKRTHDRGWGLAVAALWIGYWNVLFGLIIVIGWAASFATSLGPAHRIVG
jgi:hypothetical protein